MTESRKGLTASRSGLTESRKGLTVAGYSGRLANEAVLKLITLLTPAIKLSPLSLIPVTNNQPLEINLHCRTNISLHLEIIILEKLFYRCILHHNSV